MMLHALAFLLFIRRLSTQTNRLDASIEQYNSRQPIGLKLSYIALFSCSQQSSVSEVAKRYNRSGKKHSSRELQTEVNIDKYTDVNN